MFGIYYLLLDLDTDLTIYHPVMFVIKNCFAMDCLSCQIHAEKRIETDREKIQIYGRRIYTKSVLVIQTFITKDGTRAVYMCDTGPK